MTAAATAATVGYMLYKGCEKYNEWEKKRQAQDLIDKAGGLYPQGTRRLDENSYLKYTQNKRNYFPDRPLPRDKRTGEPKPDVQRPHTQLGVRKSKRTSEKYPQAREFDKQGRPVRDIDFTDHRLPKTHPNPHQHRYEENKNGGTKLRSKEALPLNKESKSK